MSPLASRLSCLVALGAALASPVHAEGNRLLPFWGQPYPYGYAWTRRPEATLTPRGLAPEPMPNHRRARPRPVPPLQCGASCA